MRLISVIMWIYRLPHGEMQEMHCRKRVRFCLEMDMYGYQRLTNRKSHQSHQSHVKIARRAMMRCDAIFLRESHQKSHEVFSHQGDVK